MLLSQLQNRRPELDTRRNGEAFAGSAARPTRPAAPEEHTSQGKRFMKGHLWNQTRISRGVQSGCRGPKGKWRNGRGQRSWLDGVKIKRKWVMAVIWTLFFQPFSVISVSNEICPGISELQISLEALRSGWKSSQLCLFSRCALSVHFCPSQLRVALRECQPFHLDLPDWPCWWKKLKKISSVWNVAMVSA